MLLRDQLHLVYERRDDADFRPDSLPCHLFLDRFNQRLMLLLEQAHLSLNIHQGHLPRLLLLLKL